MNVINIRQGSQEWLDLRAKHYTASEAPAMLGVSKYVSRQELLHQKATGLDKEVGPAQQAIFNKGHAAEAAARPIAEGIVGEELYPATVTEIIDGLPLLASCDGMTMLGDTLFEHKLYNAELMACIRSKSPLPEHYTVQMEQALMVTGAERCLFMCSDGTEDNCAHVYYESDPVMRQRIIDGWKQFADDLSNYQHSEEPAQIAAEPVMDLPAVSVQVSGSIDIIDNFKVFEDALRDFIDNRLIRSPQTDQDFADLDSQIKSLKKAEDALDSAEAAMLSQVATVDAMKRTKDMLHKLARDNRLVAEKLLKAEKENRRMEILNGGIKALTEHVAKINETLGGKIQLPPIAADFAVAMKGKRTITSLRDAADTTLAHAKIEANRMADSIRVNLATLREDAKGYETLFADAQQLVMKDNDDLKNLIKNRVAEHKAAEQERLEAERQRIRAEEEAKAVAKAASESAAKVASITPAKHQESAPIAKPEQRARTADKEAEPGVLQRYTIETPPHGKGRIEPDPQGELCKFSDVLELLKRMSDCDGVHCVAGKVSCGSE